MSKLKKRIVMLTQDISIDRRIISEAISLSQNNDVIIVSVVGINEDPNDQFEEIRGIQVYRVLNNGTDTRFYLLYFFRMASLFLAAKICMVVKFVSLGQFNRQIDKIYRYWTKIVNRFFGLLQVNLCRFLSMTSGEYLFYEKALKFQPDIIHIHDLPLLNIGVELKKDVGCKLVFDAHEFYTEQASIPLKKRQWLRRIEKKSLPYIDLLITVNPFIAGLYKKIYSYKKVKVIQNAVEESVASDITTINKFHEFIPETKGKKILLFQGWITEERNLKVLIDAFINVKKNDWALVFMGYGNYGDELKEYALSKQLKNIHFMDARPQEELLSFTSSATMGVIPYSGDVDLNHKYCSPNKLYEFISVKLPIIASDLPFLRSVILDEGIGDVFNPSSSQELADLLNRMTTEKVDFFKQRYSQLGSKYMWSQEEAKLLKYYAEM